MQEARIGELASLCHVPLWTCVPALLYVLLVQHRAREAVGEVLAAHRDVRTRVVRVVVPGAALVALFAGSAAAADSELLFEALAPAFECLALAIVLAWYAPSAEDRVVGRSGLQLGWSSARWEDVEDVRVESGSVCVSIEGGVRRVALAPDAAEALRSELDG